MKTPKSGKAPPLQPEVIFFDMKGESQTAGSKPGGRAKGTASKDKEPAEDPAKAAAHAKKVKITIAVNAAVLLPST